VTEKKMAKFRDGQKKYDHRKRWPEEGMARNRDGLKKGD
jgi:hypothetical protein